MNLEHCPYQFLLVLLDYYLAHPFMSFTSNLVVKYFP